jgi:hypothetical protein
MEISLQSIINLNCPIIKLFVAMYSEKSTRELIYCNRHGFSPQQQVKSRLRSLAPLGQPAWAGVIKRVVKILTDPIFAPAMATLEL